MACSTAPPAPHAEPATAPSCASPPPPTPTLRRRVARQLDPGLRAEPGLSRTNMAVCGLIVLAVLVAVLGTEKPLYARYQTTFLGVEVGLTGLLALEYVARVWCSVENPAWGGSRLRYMCTPAACLDLAAVLVILTTAFASEGFLMRLAMLLRVLRIARIGRFSSAFDTLAEAVSSRAIDLVLSVGVSLTLLLLSSAAMYLVEADVQPEAFGSIPRAMWWSVATLTTVGYGDVYPVTVLGRLFAAVTAITGIGLIAMPTGILASAFSDAFQRQRQREAKAEAEARASSGASSGPAGSSGP
ncbi:ion transporter [Roseospira marina]|uniref:Ion transporter n=1 Tax=Roseospira marina TaxID=140057 RepID=A0A5M6IAM4_9PROT|nr:ion transporter [Roseospira marina]KAA5605326.1 ion transporter [Roseospira marina]MBB4314797.1 voltage-gated potassium channel [Roseospira marina]MBB5087786.1 voltage-gated potassium channel [Roseospira marina]